VRRGHMRLYAVLCRSAVFLIPYYLGFVMFTIILSIYFTHDVLFIITYHYLSLLIITYHYLSLLIITYHYSLLSPCAIFIMSMCDIMSTCTFACVGSCVRVHTPKTNLKIVAP
jgi:hypothetical protein